METLAGEIEQIAERAAALAPTGFGLGAVLAAERAEGERGYLCAFISGEERVWAVLADGGSVISDRLVVRDVVSVAALCELAADSAFPGDLTALIASLAELAAAEAPDGIDRAIAAAEALAGLLAVEPALASPQRLDAIGAAARRLEIELGDATSGSPFSAVMRGASQAIGELAAEVEQRYLVAFAR